MANAANIKDISISTRYSPCAIYYSEADYVEYLREDVPSVQRRIDEYLTVSLDLYTRSIIGFRFKGFKNFYLQHLKQTQQIFHGDRFLSMVSVIEKTVEIVGHRCFESDKDRAAVYEEVRKMAREYNVFLTDDKLMAA